MATIVRQKTRKRQMDFSVPMPIPQKVRSRSTFQKCQTVATESLPIARRTRSAISTSSFSTSSGKSASSSQAEANCEETKPSVSSASKFQGKFGSRGGTLKGKNSDVELRIPAGTIKDSEVVTIAGTVSIDLALAHEKWKLPEKRYIASPVVEYFACGKPTDFRFESPVEIILPHFLPPKAKEMCVAVYQVTDCQQNGYEVKELEPISKSQLQETSERQAASYYLGEDNKIHVFVDHFSAFCAAFTCEGVCPPDDLCLDLYARHVKKEDGSRVVNVRLEIRNSRLKLIKDFEKARGRTENLRSLISIDNKILDAFESGRDTSDVTVSLRLVLAGEQDDKVWKHATTGEGSLAFPVENKIPLQKFLACKCMYHTLPRVVEWELTNSVRDVPSAVFKCYVEAKYITREHDQHYSPANVTIRLEIPETRLNPRGIQETGTARHALRDI